MCVCVCVCVCVCDGGRERERERVDIDTRCFVVGWWERGKLKREGSPTNGTGEDNVIEGGVD